MSEEEVFKSLFTQIAGFWPKTKAERDQILTTSPGFLTCVFAGAYKLGGSLTSEEADQLSDMFAGLLAVHLRAHNGDEMAKSQLQAIKKLISPGKYQVPLNVIEELAKKYNTHGPLVRGWEIRRLMAQLVPLITSVDIANQDPTKGPIKLTDSEETQGSDLYQEAASHCRKGTTLQSLAIRIYLGRLEKSGDQHVDIRSLKRDLQKVREWEVGNYGHMRQKESLARSLDAETIIPLMLPTVNLSENTLPVPPPRSQQQPKGGDPKGKSRRQRTKKPKR